MKKIALFFVCLALCGCVHEYNQKDIYAVSNEKNTNIFLNDEYQGAETAKLHILNKNAKESYVTGEKKGCKPAKMQIIYKFDPTIFWILNPYNIYRLITWQPWIVDEGKTLYNVTPRCD